MHLMMTGHVMQLPVDVLFVCVCVCVCVCVRVGGWVGGVFFTSRKQTKFRQIVDGTQVSHDKAKLIKGIIYELQSFSGLF